MSFLSWLMADERRKSIVRERGKFFTHFSPRTSLPDPFYKPCSLTLPIWSTRYDKREGEWDSSWFVSQWKTSLVLFTSVLFLTLTVLLSRCFHFPFRDSSLYCTPFTSTTEDICATILDMVRCSATPHFDLLHILWAAANLTSMSFCWGDFVCSEGCNTIPKQLMAFPPLPAELTDPAFRLQVCLMNSETTPCCLLLYCQ